MDLRKYIRKTLSESLIGEDYPTQFDINVFKSLKTFKQRIEYCENNLNRLNNGSSRIVYKIDNKKVLKLAKNKKGIKQNDTETDLGSGSYFSSILAKVFDSHPDGLWVEMELAIPINKYEFRRLTNFEINDVGKYLINFQTENSGQKQPYNLQKELIDRFDNDEFIQQLREFVAGTDSSADDLGQASSYGIVRRDGHDELVLIDFGLTTEIYKDFYTESKLNELIKKTINESVIKEYLTHDTVALKSYFSLTDEQHKQYLPEQFSYFFKDFLIEEGIEFEMPKTTVPSDYMDEPDVEVDQFEDDYELMNWLQRNNKELYNKFADYLFQKLKDNTLPIPEAEVPAWSYFDSPQLVKNQWLIHFTKDARSIAAEGFKYGINEIDRLGLTTSLGEFEKKYGGYNFSYLLSDFQRYGYKGYGKYKYGDEAVIFRASGIKVWHHGDQEPQVIFYGNTATDIIPITEGENNKWAVRSSKTMKSLYEDDELQKIVDWISKNYEQYRKSLRESIEPTLEEDTFNDQMAAYKKWKRKNVTLRGMSQGVGNENGSGARFGSGLYTASLANKQMANGYGDVYFVVNGRPKNPAKFKDVNQAEIWISRNITHKNYKNIREFNQNTTIEAEMLKLGYDGLEVVGREIVNYKPKNVMYFANENQLIGYYENSIESKESDGDLIKEKFNVEQNTLEISAPYDDIEKITIGNKVVYVLFGNVDYYQNKESILAIKRKSSKLNLDHKSYNEFLQEFKRRFFSISDLSKTNLLVSVETTGPINNEMSTALNIKYIKDGFKKNNPLFKMKDIDLQDRGNIKDLFSLGFQLDESKLICIMDDFITSGTTFKNAFDKLPEGAEVVGVCLFKLNS